MGTLFDTYLFTGLPGQIVKSYSAGVATKSATTDCWDDPNLIGKDLNGSGT